MKEANMTDRELQQHVQNALAWDPSVTSTDVGVTTDNGVVTLRGDVSSYTEKQAAERIALHVFGVKAVANDLAVRLPDAYERTDSELAQACVSALKMSTVVPRGGVSVAVSDGWVTLTGTVEWQFQKEAAARAVRDLAGVRGVANSVVLRPQVRVGDIQNKIEAALRRSAEIDARRINVSVQDHKVTLTGNVHSWIERQAAERAVWSAPGVSQVDDRITVVP
jgi:osmotically-inducible protein OsmY